MCKAFASSAQRDVKEQVKSLHSIFNVWYNTSGDVKEFCLRGKCAGGDDALGAMQGWTWQVGLSTNLLSLFKFTSRLARRWLCPSVTVAVSFKVFN